MYLGNFSCSGLSKYVACGMFISTAACNIHINENHRTREKSNKLFLKKTIALDR
jgi:hypothetical protein